MVVVIGILHFKEGGGELKGERERESGMMDVPDIGTTG